MSYPNRLFILGTLLGVVAIHAQIQPAPACAVCHQPFVNGETINGESVFHCPAGSQHHFHDACLASLMTSDQLNARCPICHAPLKDEPTGLGPLSQAAFDRAQALAERTISPTPDHDGHQDHDVMAARLEAVRNRLLEHLQEMETTQTAEE